jgi:hypothetical protein
MPYLLIIPMLNYDIRLIRGPFFSISENIFIEKLTDEEHSAFFRYENKEIRNYLAIDETKCLKAHFDIEPTEEQINLEGIKLSFLLNLFAESSPIIIQWAAIIERGSKLTIKKIQVFDPILSLTDFSDNQYKIRTGITRQAIFELYKRLTNAIIADQNAKFTIRRFNSSLLRLDFYDQLIDTTICLESLISGTTELSFKFSLFLSYISKDLPAERNECFQKLKILYDVRSKIVHGEVEASILAKIAAIKADWSYFNDVLKSTLIYYLIYSSDRTRKQWNNHLLNIILGTENKINL